MIFQNKPQLDAAYPDGLSDTIIGNCSTILCLACNDLVTAKFLSDRSGTATVALDQTRVDRPVLQFGAVPTSVAHTYSLGKRAVLDLAEILTLDPQKVLITITSANLFMADKFPYTDMVKQEALRVVNMYDHVPVWREKMSYKPSELPKKGVPADNLTQYVMPNVLPPNREEAKKDDALKDTAASAALSTYRKQYREEQRKGTDDDPGPDDDAGEQVRRREAARSRIEDDDSKSALSTF